MLWVQGSETTQADIRGHTKQDIITWLHGRNWPVRDNSTDSSVADWVPRRSCQQVFKEEKPQISVSSYKYAFHQSGFKDEGLSLGHCFVVHLSCSHWFVYSRVYSSVAGWRLPFTLHLANQDVSREVCGGLRNLDFIWPLFKMEVVSKMAILFLLTVHVSTFHFFGGWVISHWLYRPIHLILFI